MIFEAVGAVRVAVDGRARGVVDIAFLRRRDHLVERVGVQPVVVHVGRRVPRPSGCLRRRRFVLGKPGARVAYGGNAGCLTPYGRLDGVYKSSEPGGGVLPKLKININFATSMY